MEMEIGKLGLKIPVQETNASTQFKFDQESIKQWRSALPMADIGAAAKKIFLLLNELNKIKLDTNRRFDILELIRPPVQLICQALKKHYVNQTTPLSKQKFTIANLAETLQTEMANGYKIVLEETYTKSGANLKDVKPMIIFRIMHYYSMILLRNYQLYSQEKTDIWKELHLLYKLARKESCLKTGIENASLTKVQSSTIDSKYIQALLLAASNPYQWKQNEQETINGILEIWAPYVKLRPYTEADLDKPSLYLTDLEQDLAPRPLGLYKREISKSNIILDLGDLCSHLNVVLQELEENEIKARIAHDQDKEYEISASTLHRLLGTWNAIIARKHKRFVVSGKMQAIFGLAATHHYVGEGKPFEPKQIPTNKQEDQSSSEMPMATEEITLELIEDEDTHATAKKANQENYTSHECSLLNISPNGFCLIWDEETYPLVQPGEIIATKTIEDSDQGKSPWNIGVIRWLKHANNGKIRVGVQLLAAYSNAAGGQIIKEGNPVGYFLRCLILPAMEDLGINSSIITPTLPFSKGKTINLYNVEQDSMVSVQLVNQIDSTSSYRQFEYSTQEDLVISSENKTPETVKTEEVKPKKITPDKNNGEEDEFSSIWDQL